MHPSRTAQEQEWLTDFADLVAGPQMPLLRGVVYFNAPHNLRNYSIDGRLRDDEIDLLRRTWNRPDGFETAVSTPR